MSEVTQLPPKGGFFSRVESDAREAVADVEAVIAAIERWYAAHYHKAALAGRAPIPADDKAELVQAVTSAITQVKE